MASRINYVSFAFVLALLCVSFLILQWYRVGDCGVINCEMKLQATESSGERGVSKEELEGLREQLRSLRALQEEMSCKINQIGARGGFCLTPENIDVGWNHDWDMKLCAHLEEGLFKDQEVVDFGAGLGWYGMYWTRKTIPFFSYGQAVEAQYFFNITAVMNLMKNPMKLSSYQGFDGAGNVELVTNGFIKYLDLSEKQDLGKKFDWVISLEVGEHIPAAFEKVFIENLIRHACKGVVLSWAVIGQTGHFHVNNHDNDYIKIVFEGYGFENLLEEEKKLRSDMSLGHLTNTLMVFQRKKILQHPSCPTQIRKQ